MKIKIGMTICVYVNFYNGRKKGTGRRDENIHLSAYMNCEGELIFDHCIINYNESDYGNGIALSENAKLTITNSVVICKGLDENTFITCKGKNKIILDRNSFEDCSYFINTDGECEFFMTNCQLHNCYKDFININANAYYEKNIIPGT